MPLKLVIRKDTPYFWLRGTVCGTRAFKSTKLTDRKLAEAMRKRIQREIETEHAFGIGIDKSFDDACDAYLVSGGSARFLPPLRKLLGSKKLKHINQAGLDDVARKLHPMVQPETLNRQVYTPFMAVWNYATENGWARLRKWRRPARRRGTWNAPSVKRSGATPVEYDTAASFLAAMSPAPAMLMSFLFYTGMRPIEAFALQAHDIDLKKRWIVVRSSKTGQPRGVPVHSWLCEWLPDFVDRGGTVFRTTIGLPYQNEERKGSLKTAIRGARTRSGITSISPYTARHTVSTQLVVNGVHQHIKDQILGHAVDNMSRRYTNVPQSALIEAIDTLPVPAAFSAMAWASSPKAWWGRLVEGAGRRTDLGG